MQLLRYCTVAVLALTIAAPAAFSQPAAPPVEGASDFTVFVGGSAIGRELVRLTRVGGNWVITSTARLGAPVNLTVNRFEIKYTADWQPIDLQIDAVLGTRAMRLATSFGMTTAVSEITQNGVTNSKTDQISVRTVVLPNNFYGAYEALAARLSTAEAGTDLPAYIAPQTEIRIAVKSVTAQQIQSPGGLIATRLFDVSFQNPTGPLDASITIDSRSRLVRVEIPAATLSIVRSDLATVATRAEPVRNPNDVDVTIPASGFSLAGSLTMPRGTGRLKQPAVILVGGSGPVGRDETVAGIPIFAQLAGGLAEQGYVVLRYDKRGVGQSGGRSETVTLSDYADDLRAAVKWLAKRDDIDGRRIALAGHSEGGAVAMLAAAHEDKVASLVLIATPGTTGQELVLEQQRHLLDVMNAPEAERQSKIDLQTRIQTAVITDKGWEALPPELRKQADSPWFRSLLLFDPAKVMPRIKPPILIVQGDLDAQVPPLHADKLATLARARKKASPVEVVHLPGVNHLLVTATTGEVSEYRQLTDKTISPAAVKAIIDWLKDKGWKTP